MPDRISSRHRPPLRVHSVSLGCPKTRVDTETLLGALGPVRPVDSPAEAELVFINTCGFITPAVEESVAAILAAAETLGETPDRRPLLAVAGCLVSRYGKELTSGMDDVDLWLPLDAMHDWPVLVAQALGVDRETPAPGQGRLLSTGPSYAYLKISEGCSHACAFCTIPSIRGRLKSSAPEHLFREARSLLESGVRELVLVAQDLTAYGRDLDSGTDLARLVEGLVPLPGLDRLRLMYLYPAGLTDTLLDFLASCGPPVLPYFDIPLQHAHPEILSRMGRPFARDPRLVLDRVRKRFPDAALRTSVIVGFPGETDEHFRRLEDFVREVRFHHLGAFPFWPEEGTPAAAMADQVDEALRDARVRRVMEIQREVSRHILEGYVGEQMEVLVDEASEEWPGLHLGRTWFQAPEADGVTYVSGPDVAPGRLVRARIEQAGDYDLSALA